MHPTDEELEAARIVYGFHFLRRTPIASDVIIAFGTNDIRVAEHAAGLFNRGFGESLVCTGGIAHKGDLLETEWDGPEADIYRDVAIRQGVPPDRILVENQATNTAENIRFTRKLLGERGLAVRDVIIVVKPFMQRRALATIEVEWPEIGVSLASPDLSLDEYFTSDLPADKVLHILMGDLQRLWIYAGKGWSAPQKVPPDVMDAYRFLKSKGWTRHLLADNEENLQ